MVYGCSYLCFSKWHFNVDLKCSHVKILVCWAFFILGRKIMAFWCQIIYMFPVSECIHIFREPMITEVMISPYFSSTAAYLPTSPFISQSFMAVLTLCNQVIRGLPLFPLPSSTRSSILCQPSICSPLVCPNYSSRFCLTNPNIEIWTSICF